MNILSKGKMGVKLVNAFTRKRILFFLVLISLILISYAAVYSNVFLRFLFHEKIWVHRVNSTEKLIEVKDKFNGVELDVVFIDSLNVFDVNHPPALSINLNLLTYLQTCNKQQLYFWLDFKNLNNSNYKSALERLNKISDQINIDKKKIIIESPDVKLLKKYQDEGYNTSYYLHWPGLYQLEEEALHNYVKEVKRNINETKVLNISSNYHDYKILKEYFPNNSKLLWLTGAEKEYSFSLKERLFLYEILIDENVKVVLFPYNSKVKNR